MTKPRLVRIGFSFASDWLRGWREFSRPITMHSEPKPMQSRITFDTQLKIALFGKEAIVRDCVDIIVDVTASTVL